MCSTRKLCCRKNSGLIYFPTYIRRLLEMTLPHHKTRTRQPNITLRGKVMPTGVADDRYTIILNERALSAALLFALINRQIVIFILARSWVYAHSSSQFTPRGQWAASSNEPRQYLFFLLEDPIWRKTSDPPFNTRFSRNAKLAKHINIEQDNPYTESNKRNKKSFHPPGSLGQRFYSS